MVNHQLEEGVHQQNAISEDAAAVQKNRLQNQKKKIIHNEYKLNCTAFCSVTLHGWIYNHLWRAVERVRVEDGLYHNERLCQILTHKMMPVVG